MCYIKIKANHQPKSGSEASLSQTRAELNLKRMVIEENYKEVSTPMNMVWQILVEAKLFNVAEKIEEKLMTFMVPIHLKSYSSNMQRVLCYGSKDDE